MGRAHPSQIPLQLASRTQGCKSLCCAMAPSQTQGRQFATQVVDDVADEGDVSDGLPGGVLAHHQAPMVRGPLAPLAAIGGTPPTVNFSIGSNWQPLAPLVPAHHGQPQVDGDDHHLLDVIANPEILARGQHWRRPLCTVRFWPVEGK